MEISEESGQSIKMWKPVPGIGIERQEGRRVTSSLSKHFHTAYTIFQVLDGSIEFWRPEHGPTHVGSGAILFTNPCEVHSCEIQHSCSYSEIIVDPGLINEFVYERTEDSEKKFYFPQFCVFSQRVYDEFSSVLNALDDPETLVEVRSALFSFLEVLVDRWGNDAYTTEPFRCQDERIERVKQYIRNNLEKDLSWDTLAEVAALSKYHFLRVFEKEVGLSPHQYVIQQRILRSKKALLRGEPIAEVARQTGFSDQSHFTRHFKRRLRMTPGEYVKANQTRA